MDKNKSYETLIKNFKADKVKNANIIVDFLQLTESNGLKDLKLGIRGLQTIFSQLLQDDDIKVATELPDDLMRASEKFNNWLYEMYVKAHQKLRSLLAHEDDAVSELALSAIIKLIQVEGHHPVIKKSHNDDCHFPTSRLQALVKELVSDSINHQHSIGKLKEYMECQDFMLYTLVSLSVVVKRHRGKKISEVYMNNLILMLEHVNIPDVNDNVIICTKLFLDKNANKPAEELKKILPSEVSYGKAKRAINIIWPKVMSYPLTGDLYRRCLILIPEKVIQHLEKPLRLTGFFMDAYNLGGAISLLALQGVFILVNKYNLDYPNFYQKLYSLLEPTVFHAKYRPRFFMLLDRFLASTHLPEYIVAAFMKRLARLSLVAPASCLVLILKFIANLLIRYPGLQRLIHNPEANDLENDPFDPDEPDLSKCRASESSLWEVATLKHHVIPKISKATGFLEKTLPIVEYDIGELVETTYEEVHEQACKLIIREKVSTTFHKPSGLFAHQEDKMSEVWSVM